MNNKEEIKNFLTGKDKSIRDALKIIDKGGRKILFVIDEKNELYGSLTDGDIRRWILKKGELVGKVSQACNLNPLILRENYKIENVKFLMTEKQIESIPVLNNENEVVDILFWEDVFRENFKREYKKIDSYAVVMAGGKGMRLDPFTRVLPKPLVPIGEKVIIEVIMEEYNKYGIEDFYVSLNHKARMIKAYFEDHKYNFNIHYIEEKRFLGTAGSLKYLENKFDDSFFVSNCDILVKEDYSGIYDFHKKGKYVLTLVASMQNHVIPYGVCEIENGGTLKSIKEKPEYSFLINTGMYILNPDILKLIPENNCYHITDLVLDIQKKRLKIGVYPISEKLWHDVGQWEEYKKAMRIIEDI
jgi:dTDP-glucose pyrophosphorylase/predicted transcriptional regulator